MRFPIQNCGGFIAVVITSAVSEAHKETLLISKLLNNKMKSQHKSPLLTQVAAVGSLGAFCKDIQEPVLRHLDYSFDPAWVCPFSEQSVPLRHIFPFSRGVKLGCPSYKLCGYSPQQKGSASTKSLPPKAQTNAGSHAYNMPLVQPSISHLACDQPATKCSCSTQGTASRSTKPKFP